MACVRAGSARDLEPTVRRLYETLFETIALHGRAGFDVIADLGIHDAYSRPLGIADLLADRLAGLPVLMVGVTCPDDAIIARRRRETRDGFYVLDPTIVARWREAVAAGKHYDLVIDTSTTTPEAGARRIVEALAAKHR